MWLGLVKVAPGGGGPDQPARREWWFGSDPYTLALWLFLASLTALFAPLLVSYLKLRLEAAVWPPPGMPPLPRGLWLSTAALLGVSGCLHAALRSVQHDGLLALRRWMLAAAALALTFLLSQALCWKQLLDHKFPMQAWQLAGLFTFFAALHAVHVTGGLAPLLLVMHRSLRGRYSRRHYDGVRLCAIYWHFLDAVWLVMFTAMMLPSG